MKRLENLGILATAALFILTFTSLGGGEKVAAIGWIAFAAMALGGLAASREFDSSGALVWSYGVSGGAALASVMFFILPQALKLSSDLGAAGIVLGFVSGLGLHTLSHELSHHRKGLNTLWSVSIHSAVAGGVIGLIYQQMPSISILLGVAIVSHKLPAGYMIADRFRRSGEEFWKLLLVPASGVGVMGLLVLNFPVALSSGATAIFFGFSTGIFLHVALDFLPDPEPESHLRKMLHEEADPFHQELDAIRFHSVLSTFLGAGLVTALALVI